MGQSQSDTTVEEQNSTPPAAESSPPTSSMEALFSEAIAFGDDNNESLDAKAQKALECPCLAGLRSGPCGSQFSEAFVCFLKSTAQEKGSDCVHPFVALQNCIKENPDAFSKDLLDGEEDKKDEVVTEFRIIPPTWSRDSRQSKSRN